MSTIRSGLLVLLALSGVAYAEDLALPVGGGTVVPVGDLTLPGALVALGWMLARWKPTIRLELVGPDGRPSRLELITVERRVVEEHTVEMERSGTAS